jgi:hypothetical protein
MAALTPKQIEDAAKEMFECCAEENIIMREHLWSQVKGTYRRMVIAAAPYLQLQLVNASTEEINSILATYRNSLRVNGGNERDAITTAVGWLIAARNAAFQPKPVDPRFARILKLTKSWDPESADEKAVEILAALDEV